MIYGNYLKPWIFVACRSVRSDCWLYGYCVSPLCSMADIFIWTRTKKNKNEFLITQFFKISLILINSFYLTDAPKDKTRTSLLSPPSLVAFIVPFYVPFSLSPNCIWCIFRFSAKISTLGNIFKGIHPYYYCDNGIQVQEIHAPTNTWSPLRIRRKHMHSHIHTDFRTLIIDINFIFLKR